MDYNLTVKNISLSQQEREMIDTRMALTLSRFANLISSFDITFSAREQTETNLPVVCTIKVSLQAGHQIDVHDSANSVDSALSQSVQRTKRAIERHLKHLRGPRLGSSITSRT